MRSCACGISSRFRWANCRESAERNAALVKLAKRDVADGYVRVAVLSSLGEGAGEVLKHAGRRSTSSSMRRKAARCWRAWPRRSAGSSGRRILTADAQGAADLAKANSPALPTIIQRLAAQSGHAAGRANCRGDRRQGGDADEVAAGLRPPSGADEAAPLKARVAAVEQLRLAHICRSARSCLASLLAPAVAGRFASGGSCDAGLVRCG